jgi:KaiC/GvpD/RAD55 family RecA-like ATPase
MIQLTKTGIEGLDSILNGGIVENSTTLISGNPGAGKSLLCLQYIYNGVEMFDENGIYLSFEEDKSDIREAAEAIGFDKWPEHVENGNIKVYDKQVLLRENDFSSSLDILLDDLEDDSYDRLVLDSLAMFELFFENEQERRTYLLKLSDILKANGLTTLMTNEQGETFPDADVGLENYLTDGNIYLIQKPTDFEVNRYVWVAKMRKQNIDTDVFPLEIEWGGIKVHENASAFSMMGEDESPL